jgi:hypothetical protein
MKAFDHLCRFFLRFRYPVSLPEDVAQALGLEISNYVTFEQFISRLSSPTFKPSRLMKFMPREKAEEAFQNAQSKERFKSTSLFSFYFSQGWMEFVLEFDDQSRLRRLYLHHKIIQEERGKEILLEKSNLFTLTPQTCSEQKELKAHF